MASLFERAGIRCEQNILRRWPAWRQAELDGQKPWARPAFEAWKAANVDHLKALRAAIVAGETPDIDRGWPDPKEPLPESAIPLAAEFPKSENSPPPSPEPVPAEPMITVTASYTFSTDFIDQERAGRFESREEADRRLLEEYESLEVARPLDTEREARRRTLFDNFYDFKG
jgi:hypothetical protein